MQAENVLSILLNIQSLSTFIKCHTSRCQHPTCLVNLIKTLSSSSASLTKHLPDFKLAISNLFGSSYTLYELLFLVLLEFHDHELTHCKGSEYYCLLHTFFPSSFSYTCRCGTYLESIPSLKADILPQYKCEPHEHHTEKHFRTLFKANKTKLTAECGCVKEYSVSSQGELLFFTVENCDSSHFLSFLASVPSNLSLAEVFNTNSGENYNLFGFLMVVKETVEVFCKKTGLSVWEIGGVTNRKETTFINGVKLMIQANALPLAIIYTHKSEEFYIEKQHFICIEQLNIRRNPGAGSKAFISSCQLGQRYLWYCENCDVFVNSIVCKCAARKQFWKCECGKVCEKVNCECGKSRPVCQYCAKEFDPYTIECRRCGGEVNIKGECNICKFTIFKTCSRCYFLLESCTVCFSLCDPRTFACMRCMNPFIKLFKT